MKKRRSYLLIFILAVCIFPSMNIVAQTTIKNMTEQYKKHTAPFACTSLIIKDLNGNVYHGRGMEFTTDQIITNLTYYPKGHVFQHQAPDKTLGLKYVAKYPILALTAPVSVVETKSSMEGINEAGLSFSLNMITNAALNDIKSDEYKKSVPFASFGEWGLANFATVQELKQAVKDVAFWSEELAIIGGLKSPFHFAFYDKNGGSIVVEVSDGVLQIYDNPTGVMTNGPEFPWHLTNLNNYSHLTNVDKTVGKIGAMTLVQPDSGIATSTLPSSSTSVGRFVRAFYFSTYANKVNDPDMQVIELAHIMNNFDRPKNITIDTTGEGEKSEESKYTTEFTVWTALSDLSRGELYVRLYSDLNYRKYTFDQFKKESKTISIPLK
ncbi:linear amide C-N hydrolase [Myroides odoratimimus]|uniref:linear amide C-N hydrolase n=1 Tax=Myroides odoratimimus TaxID=76832 RepID=UPI000469AC23|nr:linear amide C-N hydrolase [Myroides odoratimimus]